MVEKAPDVANSFYIKKECSIIGHLWKFSCSKKTTMILSLLLNPILTCLCAGLYLGGSHFRKTLKLQWVGSPQFSSLLFSQYLLAWKKFVIFHSWIFSHTGLMSETLFVILGNPCPICLGLWKCSHLVFVPLKFWGRQVLLWLFLFCSLTLWSLSARKKPPNLPKWLCKHVYTFVIFTHLCM